MAITPQLLAAIAALSPEQRAAATTRAAERNKFRFNNPYATPEVQQLLAADGAAMAQRSASARPAAGAQPVAAPIPQARTGTTGGFIPEHAGEYNQRVVATNAATSAAPVPAVAVAAPVGPATRRGTGPGLPQQIESAGALAMTTALGGDPNARSATGSAVLDNAVRLEQLGQQVLARREAGLLARDGLTAERIASAPPEIASSRLGALRARLVSGALGEEASRLSYPGGRSPILDNDGVLRNPTARALPAPNVDASGTLRQGAPAPASAPDPTRAAASGLAELGRLAMQEQNQPRLATLGNDAQGRPVQGVIDRQGNFSRIRPGEEGAAQTVKVGNRVLTVGPGNRYFDEQGNPVDFGRGTPPRAPDPYIRELDPELYDAQRREYLAYIQNQSSGEPAGVPREMPEMSDRDRQALAWANSNPKDPRAVKIKARLGVQ